MDTKAFKTKTDFINRDNGQLAGTWLIAMDIGYSAVKLFAPNKVGIFPSYAQQYANCGTIGTLPNDYITYTDLDTNEQWLVGNAAQKEAASNDSMDTDDTLFGRHRYYDPMFKVIARTGLGIGLISNKYGERGNKKICIQTGLPPKYKEDADALREVISGRHHFSIKIGSRKAEEFEFEIAKEDVYITLQPMGTLYSVAIANNHRFVADAVNYLAKNILIFDAGFGTFDLFLVENHRIIGGQTFPNLGMKQVLANTADAIYKKYSQIVTVTGMQKCLETGMVRKFNRSTFNTDDLPFDDLLEKSVRDVCNEAIEKMGQVYPIQDVDYLVITGGTGAAWNSLIRERLKGMSTLKILDGNQNDTSLPFVFANVRGYYMHRYSQLQNKAA